MSASTSSMVASFAKLNDGSWGLLIKGPAPAVGSEVLATTRAGRVEVKRVLKVVWHGTRDGHEMSLVTFENTRRGEAAATRVPHPPTAPPSRRWSNRTAPRRTRQPCGYPGCDGIRFCDECSEIDPRD